MSALDGWIDVCRTGQWRDARGRDVAVDEAMLDDLVAAHDTADPAPVVVGHPAEDAPAYAWVSEIRRTGDRLQARFERIMPAFREAVEAGRYAGRSIAVSGGRLRHVGFLGGRAPAVPGLSPTQFASAAETVIAFAVDGEDALWQMQAGWRAMSRIARAWRDHLIEDKGLETADRVIPEWEVESMSRAAEALREDAALAGIPGPDVQKQTNTDEDNTMTKPVNDQPDAAALAAHQAELEAREKRLGEREQRLAAAERAEAARQAIAPHVAAGRILPGEQASVEALMASLPDDDTRIAFSAAGVETQERPRDVLERLLAALPVRVDYGETAGGPLPGTPSANADSDAIAAEARIMMSEAAERGEVLTAMQAVDMVRAQRGIRTEERS